MFQERRREQLLGILLKEARVQRNKHFGNIAIPARAKFSVGGGTGILTRVGWGKNSLRKRGR